MTASVEWKEQHPGVHQASWQQLQDLMPDVALLVAKTFVDDPAYFTWDVKVHMLMPGQYPCIPNWHYDNVPRVNNVQDWDRVNLDKPMYLYLSGHPLTEFRKGDSIWTVPAGEWYRFTQEDEHRGTVSETFTWRGFIRATHKDILPANKAGSNPLRRHTQVYLDAANFKW